MIKVMNFSNASNQIQCQTQTNKIYGVISAEFIRSGYNTNRLTKKFYGVIPDDFVRSGYTTNQLIKKLIGWKNDFETILNTNFIFEWYGVFSVLEEIKDQFLQDSLKYELEKIEKIEEDKCLQDARKRFGEQEVAKLKIEENDPFAFYVLLDELEERNATTFIPTACRIDRNCFDYWEKTGFDDFKQKITNAIVVLQSIETKQPGKKWFEKHLPPWRFKTPKKTVFDLIEEINSVHK